MADLTIGSDQHGRQAGVPSLYFMQQIVTGHSRHVHITDNHIHRRLSQLRQGLLRIGGFTHAKLCQLKGGNQRFSKILVILNNQNLGFGHNSLRSVIL